jgi:hypothetical protein
LIFGFKQGKNLRGETGLFPMNYTSPEKPSENFIAENQQQQQSPEPQQQQQQQQEQALLQTPSQHQLYMPSPHTSSRSSGSTIEEEIDNALSQLQIASPQPPRPISEAAATLMTNNITNINDNDSNQTIENWDVEQVADWLKSVGFDSVSANFIGGFCNYKVLTLKILTSILHRSRDHW